MPSTIARKVLDHCVCAVLMGTWTAAPASAAPESDDNGRAMRLIRSECLACHNEKKHKGGLILANREALMKGGEDGAVIVEGKPEDSALIKSLTAGADPHMPPKKQLTAEQMALLTEWVRRGAPWDAAALAEASAPRAVSLAPLPPAYRPVTALSLSPDGSRLAAGCRNEVVVFDVTPTALIFRARASAHLDSVQSIAWTPDGKKIITGAFRRVVVWNAEPLTQEREITSGLTDRVTALRAVPDGARVLLADGQIAESGIIRVLDLAAAEIVRSWPAHDDTIFAMAMSPDGKLLATAGGDKLVKVWDIAAGKESFRLEAHATQVLSLAFNPDGSQLVTGGADRQLKVWDLKTRENTIALATRAASFNALTWSAAGPAVFAASEDGALLRYTDLKVHTGAQSSDTGNERELGRAESSLYCVTASAESGRIFAGSFGGRILGWDKEGKLLDNIEVMTAKAAPAAPASPPK